MVGIKELIHEGMNLFIPSKRIGLKHTLPWITQSIKRQIRKRDSLFQNLKKKTTPKLRKQFKELRSQVKTNIKKTYDDYIEYVLESETGQSDSGCHHEGQKFARKKHFSSTKNAKQDSQGFSLY